MMADHNVISIHGTVSGRNNLPVQCRINGSTLRSRHIHTVMEAPLTAEERIIPPAVAGRNIVTAMQRLSEKVAVDFLQGSPIKFGIR